jgi:ribosomal protein L11 methyltransferase
VTTPDWIALHVDVGAPLADAVARFLVELGVPSVTTDLPLAGGRAALEAHVPGGDGERLAAALERWLGDLATTDPGARDVRVRTAPLGDVDWEAVFRSHHRPVAVGARLLVAPPWDVPDAPGREILVIEPGMAFGTGQHATTRGCLEEIEAAVAGGGIRRALDVGTGSGLLAAALARLGVPRVVAVDVDAGVLPLARANLRQNGAARVLLLGGGVGAVRGAFDLVVANLLLDALVAEAAALAAAVAPRGRLVLSGLLDAQVPTVLAAYPGWRATHVRAEAAWRTLRLERSG